MLNKVTLNPIKYKLIYADPPWKYSNTGTEGAAAKHYNTEGFDYLKRLDVKSVADPDCVLLLWATFPMLAEACLPLIKAWGFDYVTGFPWIKVTDVSRNLWDQWEIKVPYGIGFWARGCAELLLIARRGKPKPPVGDFIGLLSPNLYHSRKPESLYHYAESMAGPYLEMFARRRRPGWHIWGNEVDSDIEIPLLPMQSDNE